MFNLNALMKFINVNNDNNIEKSEIEEFVAKQKSPSIFNDYLNSISNDVDKETFFKNMYNVMQKAEAEGNISSKIDFKDNADVKKYEELVKSENKDDKGYFKYSSWKPENKVVKALEEIPHGSHDDIRDARGCDISQLNLTEAQLLDLCIDKTTIMSPEQKAMLEPYKEAAKDPGLGIRKLHEQGITGKGVKIAIIDYPLGMHKEYADNIVGQVHDINGVESGWDESCMHGSAVASIAVGKNTGVAPDAGLVYYSLANLSKNSEDIKVYKENIQQEILKNADKPEYVKDLQSQLEKVDQNGASPTNKAHVEAINQILDENEKLPENERVPVISISWGFDPLAPGYEELQQAIQRAKDQGVFVVSTALDRDYNMATCGANRNPKGNLNSPDNYEAGAFWKKSSEEKRMPKEFKDKFLLIPMDHRTIADFTDDSSYRYEGNDGGMSWSTPWLAGTYALAKQVDSSITPEKFWKYALETSNECKNNDTGTYVGRIINPQGLIQKIQESKTTN